MVRYHEGGRFCDKDKDWDQESAIFHMDHAAYCGELEAIIGLGLMYSQLSHHILTEVSVEVKLLLAHIEARILIIGIWLSRWLDADPMGTLALSSQWSCNVCAGTCCEFCMQC